MRRRKRKHNKFSQYNKTFHAVDITIPYFFIPETHNQHIDFEFLVLTKQLVSINQRNMIVRIKKPPYYIIRPSRIYQTFRNTFTKELIQTHLQELTILTHYFQKHFPVYIHMDITWGNFNSIARIPLQGDIDAYIKVIIDSIFNALSTVQKQQGHVVKKRLIDDKYIDYLTIKKYNKSFKELQEQYSSLSNCQKSHYKKYIFIKGIIYKLKDKKE